jgi:DNA-binding SARP family transcriptional activator/TolB-like protein
LQLTTFGPLALTEHGKGDLPLPRKALLCAAYLAANHNLDPSREHLATILWPGDPGTARLNLRKMIERVRQCEAQGWQNPFEISASALRVSGNVKADFDAFTTDLDSIEKLRATRQLIERPFLNVAGLSGTLLAWIERQKQDYWWQFREIFVEATSHATQRSDWMTVREGGKLLLEYDPADEAVAQILLEAHQQVTGNAEAVRLQAQPRRQMVALIPQDTSLIVAQSELPRIVLLPPTLGDNAHSGIATALIDDITIGLCSLRNAAVVAPYTAARIREHVDKLGQLETHSISYVVDTKISEEGLFAQMVFLPADAVLWAERFPLTGGSLVSRRKEVAGLIVAAISDHLGKSVGQLSEYRTQPEVYRSYLVSTQHLNTYTLPGMRRARNALKDTLKLRGDFAPALAGLSRTFSWEWVLTARGDSELLVQAEALARQAVSVSPDLAAAHRDLGLSLLYRGDVDESLQSFHEAERLSPHFADALCGYADALVHASKPAEGLEKIIKAMSLNPESPDDYRWIAAGASFFLGNFMDAVSHIESMADGSSARRLLAASYAMAGDMGRARMHRRKAQELNPSFEVEKWLSILPVREKWQKDVYREGLLKAGFQ